MPGGRRRLRGREPGGRTLRSPRCQALLAGVLEKGGEQGRRGRFWEAGRGPLVIEKGRGGFRGACVGTCAMWMLCAERVFA